MYGIVFRDMSVSYETLFFANRCYLVLPQMYKHGDKTMSLADVTGTDDTGVDISKMETCDCLYGYKCRFIKTRSITVKDLEYAVSLCNSNCIIVQISDGEIIVSESGHVYAWDLDDNFISVVYNPAEYSSQLGLYYRRNNITPLFIQDSLECVKVVSNDMELAVNLRSMFSGADGCKYTVFNHAVICCGDKYWYKDRSGFLKRCRLGAINTKQITKFTDSEVDDFVINNKITLAKDENARKCEGILKIYTGSTSGFVNEESCSLVFYSGIRFSMELLDNSMMQEIVDLSHTYYDKVFKSLVDLLGVGKLDKLKGFIYKNWQLARKSEV